MIACTAMVRAYYLDRGSEIHKRIEMLDLPPASSSDVWVSAAGPGITEVARP